MLNIYYLITLLFLVLFLMNQIKGNTYQKLIYILLSANISVLLIDLVFFFKSREQAIFIYTIFIFLLLIIVQIMKKMGKNSVDLHDTMFLTIFKQTFLVFLTTILSLSIINFYFIRHHFSFQLMIILIFQFGLYFIRKWLSNAFNKSMSYLGIIAIYTLLGLFVVNFENTDYLPISSSNREGIEVISNMVSLDTLFRHPLVEDLSILSSLVYQDHLYYVVSRELAYDPIPRYEVIHYDFEKQEYKVIHTFDVNESSYYAYRFYVYELCLYQDFVYLVGANGLYVIEEQEVISIYEINRAQYQRYLIDYDYALYVENDQLIYEAHQESFHVQGTHLRDINQSKAHDQYAIFSAHLKLYYLEVDPLVPIIKKVMDQDFNMAIKHYPNNFLLNDVLTLTANYPVKSHTQALPFKGPLGVYHIETVLPENYRWLIKDVFLIELNNKTVQFEIRTNIYHMMIDENDDLYILYRVFNEETMFAKINIHENVLNTSAFIDLKQSFHILMVVVVLPINIKRKES
jgi:hypothetical protein